MASCACAISPRCSSLSQSAVSHQLRLLRGMRLVRPRRDGRIVFYSLDDQHIMAIFKQTLQHVEEEQSARRRARLAHGATGAMSRRRASAEPPRAPARSAAAHCETDTPAPTGARIRGWFTGVAAALVVVGCAIGWLTPFPGGATPLFVAATLVGSVFPAQRAWQSIKRGSLDINVLMVIAVIGAIAIREYEEAAMVVSLFAAAQWLEAQSLDRARKAIGRLLDLAPTDVLVRDDAGERRSTSSR